MKVIVIGAGMGGLTLAQALRRSGIDVAVHERDRAAEATGGYRLQLDGTACEALRRHLAPAHYQALLASSAGPQAFTRFAVADHRMRLMFADPTDRSAETLMIGRIPLRRLLAHGLDDALHWGSEFTGHEVHPDGTVTAHFADGGTDRADLLVGADGAGSRVAAALAGRPTSAPAGVSGIAGRTPLTAETRDLVPDLLAAGPALAFGPGGIGLFLTRHDPDARPMVDPATCTQVAAITEPPSLIWGLMAPDRTYPPGCRGLDGAGLIRATDALLRGWDGSVRALVRAAAPETTAFFGFHAADPAADLTPWPAGPATALGDAVHAMPPTGGRAAATAIRDADVLAGELARVRDGESTIPLAVHRFQGRMNGYAGDAVRTSMQPLRWVHRLATPMGTRAARIALPTITAAARLGRPLAGTRNG
ncbi:2-polyprenyl-6-methoxyphenol hydroxylase-like FAD-dependent oxidoreductase [Murinocardiopsis flavida]|uniref:2-polyprenyl-6-methoxyphenol hydroxylase-like FAD-dependent oxidoreductase n=1 Tax=Murinocardiopsis flavida TaxID=645275 RepID=A0A2P8DNP2_9ACTN|nr:NAD(P)/FAD-dependent oxidoreductase [Murinocardiopsis flavida]PSK98837.1 2-polyprenyl-6-methoxyphenol hydroxylase-like FAD-dependent oxidoreductase [Murinocardiopsis flavida]